MKFFEKLWNALGLFEYVEADEELDDNVSDSLPVREAGSFSSKSTNEETSWSKKPAETRAATSSFEKEKGEESSFWARKTENKKSSNLVSLPNQNRNVKVMVVTPTVFDDAQIIADHVRGGKPVVVYFEDTDADVMKRIIDFISGTVYALKGTIQLVGTDIMVCAPQNVDIDANKDFFAKTEFEPWRKD